MIARERFWLTASVLLLALVVPNPNSAQEKPRTNSVDALVMMTVTVRNRSGEHVTGLTKDAFVVTEEKVVRPIQFFESDDSPISIGILIDTSSSMQRMKLRDTVNARPIGEALSRFLKLADNHNQYFLASFDTAPQFHTDWSNPEQLLSEKINFREGKGPTAIFDACFSAIEKFEAARYSRRVLILISDGEDGASRHSFPDLRKLLATSDVVLYSIGPPKTDDGSSLGEEARGILTELAETTGGAAFFVDDKKRLGDVIELIATELRHQYRIGFLPDKTSKKWHRVKLNVLAPRTGATDLSKLKIRTRQDYYVW